MSDRATYEVEALREAVEGLTKSVRANTTAVEALRGDLKEFAERVNVIVAAVQGMGGMSTVLQMLNRFMPGGRK